MDLRDVLLQRTPTYPVKCLSIVVLKTIGEMKDEIKADPRRHWVHCPGTTLTPGLMFGVPLHCHLEDHFNFIFLHPGGEGVTSDRFFYLIYHSLEATFFQSSHLKVTPPMEAAEQ